MRVLVTGGTGCIGAALVTALVARGHEVVAAARRPPDRAYGARFAHLDLSRGAGFEAALDGAEALVHLAARAHVVPRSPAEEAEMRRINADRTAELVDAAKRAGTARLVYASTVAVYGPGQGSEAEVPVPRTIYGRSKYDGERAVTDAGGLSLRLALVFGARDRGNVATLARHVRRWGGVVLGNGENRKSLVYAPHVAERIARILESPASTLSRQAFNVVDWSPTQRELLDALAACFGRRPPPTVPLAPFRVAGSLLDLGQRALGRAPRFRHRVEKLAEITAFSGAPLDGEIEYTPPRSLLEALSQTFPARDA